MRWVCCFALPPFSLLPIRRTTTIIDEMGLRLSIKSPVHHHQRIHFEASNKSISSIEINLCWGKKNLFLFRHESYNAGIRDLSELPSWERSELRHKVIKLILNAENQEQRGLLEMIKVAPLPVLNEVFELSILAQRVVTAFVDFCSDLWAMFRQNCRHFAVFALVETFS